MKVLILQNKLLHYRIPVFNLLNSKPEIELTVAHPDIPAKEFEITFQQIILQVVHQGPFVLHKNLFKLCCYYDVVIAMFDLKWLTHMKLALKKQRPFRLIYWGIGVSTEKGFDVNQKFDFSRFFLAKRADGLLLYSEKAKEKYLKEKFPKEMLFVASNSVDSTGLNISNDSVRDCFIFLGSLNKRKGLEELIEAFRITALTNSENLLIIGDGSEKVRLQKLTRHYNLYERVHFLGHISDSNKLRELFNKAIACISPGQAGLSVLRSFSFGVPFICREDAITGGERFDIKNDHNGYQYLGGVKTLARIMFQLSENPMKVKQLGANAHNFFQSSRTLHHMVEGFVKAIESGK